MISVRFLAAIKKTSQDVNRQKYKDLEAHCQI